MVLIIKIAIKHNTIYADVLISIFTYDQMMFSPFAFDILFQIELAHIFNLKELHVDIVIKGQDTRQY